ncbi:MAG: hypothetical protein U0232_30190 [Thermomicrobiales bacterium]
MKPWAGGSLTLAAKPACAGYGGARVAFTVLGAVPTGAGGVGLQSSLRGLAGARGFGVRRFGRVTIIAMARG